MKHIIKVGRREKFRFVFIISLVFALAQFSCEPAGNRLGVDIFPPSDTILVYTDTITNFNTMLVRSRPIETSEPVGSASKNRLFYLGSINDDISGFTQAEIVTSITILAAGIFGDEPVIDSFLLSLYVAEVEGDTTQDMRIKIYEFTDSLVYGTSYYSDYDVTGKYDPEPLVDEVITPKRNTYYEFDITDQDFIDRIMDAAKDTVFQYRSLFQERFKGLYITTEPVGTGGALAKVQLANGLSGVKFRYLPDTISIDTAELSDYNSYTMGFNELYAQKVNIFHHDYTGSPLEDLIDNPDAQPEIGYAQGLAGVNTKITIPDLEDVMGNGLIAVNAANLLFYVVPDSVSGISEEDYPTQLMMEVKFEDGTYQTLYDKVINSATSSFGRLTQSNEVSAFLDPLYYYNFQVGRHLQSVITGEIENGDLVISVNTPQSSTKIIEFWSNYSASKGGLKLELIYTKF